ncbi:hypothetical protein K9N50_03615 [bacterium]|nr:hypothetical protein [bacterium]
MQIKLIPERGQDGQIDISACLFDKINDESGLHGQEQTICNLGSLGNGGLEKLIELSNSVNCLLLESALESSRDSIVCSRSYGIIYLINQIMDKWHGYSELLRESGSMGIQILHELLPSMLAALLDENTDCNSSLDEIQRRIYFPKGTDLSAATIRNLISSVDIFSDDPFFMVLNNRSNRINGNELERKLREKLLAWATSDCGPWHNFNEAEGLTRIIKLAAYFHKSIEDKTALSWQVINDNLSELQAIRVENGAKTLLMMTRPTSMQLNIFYRLNIKPPPLVIIEQNERPIISAEEAESELYDTTNSIHDQFFETCTLSVPNHI